VFQAYTTFALWDVARRAHLGVDPDVYRASMGELFAPMSEIAARNPYAWFPVARTPDEVVEAAPDNRMVAYPYTKYLISVMDVDLSGALVIASHEAADRLGVPPDRRVYVRGWCYGTDATYVAEHDPTYGSPAMAAASTEAMTAAGVGIDDIAYIDLYSCFPSSVAFAIDALGLKADDDRGFTVTGGLPYFGGAGSDYLTHSIATMVERLRTQPDALGLCSGVGMHMTKHVYGVYSAEPPSTAPRPDQAKVRATLDARPRMQIVDTFSGEASILTYTVLHGRDGQPDWGLVVCDVADGSRCYGRIADRELLDELERVECVGRSVQLETNDSKVNEVTTWAH
jgi:acetyl-CoA C-acetyltransferase